MPSTSVVMPVLSEIKNALRFISGPCVASSKISKNSDKSIAKIDLRGVGKRAVIQYHQPHRSAKGYSKGRVDGQCKSDKLPAEKPGRIGKITGLQAFDFLIDMPVDHPQEAIV